MARSSPALINPELLVWARRNAGFSIEEAAEKVRVSADRFYSWESGDLKPTIVQLRKLANVFKRPLAVFYLSDVPEDFQPLRDFRTLPTDITLPASPQLRVEIRKARYRREVALELYESLGEEPPKFDFAISPSDDTESVASEVRTLLGIDIEQQYLWSNPYEAFNSWRTAFEKSGLLVFQVRGVEIETIRGFSISDTPLPVVSINIKDSPRARIFSLLHELIHIALDEGGICDFHERSRIGNQPNTIEIFCNAVAGASIVPINELISQDIVSRKDQDPFWTDRELDGLSRRFNASRETILRRLLIAGKTTDSFYRQKREEFLKQYAEYEKPSGGFAPPSTLAISSAGPLFIRLVLNNYYQERINPSDVSELLGVRLKHLGKIEEKVFGRPIAFGAGT